MSDSVRCANVTQKRGDVRDEQRKGREIPKEEDTEGLIAYQILRNFFTNRCN